MRCGLLTWKVPQSQCKSFIPKWNIIKTQSYCNESTRIVKLSFHITDVTNVLKTYKPNVILLWRYVLAAIFEEPEIKFLVLNKVPLLWHHKVTPNKYCTMWTPRRKWLCVRFAGCCPQSVHTTLKSTLYRQLENQAPNTAGSSHLYDTLELLMMGIKVPETCWANNKICNKN
jgi:hypothetical protein